MIVCWDRCSRPTILRPHSSFAGLFARSIARSISTSTTHESDLPHETCLNPQDCRTQGAVASEPQTAQGTDPSVDEGAVCSRGGSEPRSEPQPSCAGGGLLTRPPSLRQRLR